MSNEAFEKWKSKCKCNLRTKLVGDGCLYCNTEEYIDNLSQEYDEILSENENLEREIAELKAHINDLREWLGYLWHECKRHGITVTVKGKSFTEALASTPAQSLQEHDNEVIEKCAEVCDDRAKYMKEMIMQDVVVGKADTGAMVCANAIRALIEKE